LLPSPVEITFTIFSKLSLPQEVDADTIKLPLVVIPSSNLPVEFTSNPLFGSTDAVTEPLTILNASSVIAERGISNKFAPLPLNEPLCTLTSPVNMEPLSIEVTLN